MLNLRNLLFFILSFFLCTFAQAQTDSDMLSDMLLNIHTMQADFSQTITKQKSGKSVQHTTGHMALERPGKFRWETLQPNKQLIIANGSKLWVYDPDLEQVTIQKFSSGAGKTPALLLSDKNLSLGTNFDVKVAPVLMQIAGYKAFELTPKDSNDSLEKITLSFINKQIHEMKLQDRLGNVTSITFQNVREGASLPDSLFNFKPPANVDVIDETKDKK